jgi:glycosyltransferase involved in cell wall biosynthesis
MSKRLVSVIAPVYNEDDVIEEFVARLAASTAALDDQYVFEFIFVDDGSGDHSLEILKRLALADPRIMVLELRRNYGQTPALQAGLDAARGQILITMDSDLQHFPEEIPAFLDKLGHGYDVVCGWRHQRAEGLIRRWPSTAANKLIRRLSGVDIHDFGTTFRAYTAEVIKDLRLLGEFHRYVPVLARMAGATITELPIENIPRPKGKSSYGLGRTLGVFLDLFLLYFLSRYLDRPLRAFGKLALLAFAIGFPILTFMTVYGYVTGTHMVRDHIGWFLMSIMMILTSLQIALAGLLAEILVRIHYAQGERRVYNIRRVWHRGPTDTVS